MALINCPECAAQISSAASSCPRCGYPIAARQAPPAPQSEKWAPGQLDEAEAGVRSDSPRSTGLSKTNKILAGVLGLLALAVVIAGGAKTIGWLLLGSLVVGSAWAIIAMNKSSRTKRAERGVPSEPKKASRAEDFVRLIAVAVGIVGICIVVAIVIAAMMGDDDKPTRTAAAPVKKTVPKPIQEVRAVDMVREVQRNEVAFEQAWEGKRALVRGTIQSVEADISDARLTLGANQWDTFAANGIPKNQVVSFRKGQRAEVLCESVGEVLGFAVGSSCTVRKVEP
jgi:hypothetical protein